MSSAGVTAESALLLRPACVWGGFTMLVGRWYLGYFPPQHPAQSQPSAIWIKFKHGKVGQERRRKHKHTMTNSLLCYKTGLKSCLFSPGFGRGLRRACAAAGLSELCRGMGKTPGDTVIADYSRR